MHPMEPFVGAKPSSVAICIAGMHRSGTSMVARLLNRCSVSLGPESDLLPAGPDNPDGFWENRRFLAVNEAVLQRLGGSWTDPPRPAPRWETKPDLEPLVRYAQRLTASLALAGSWAWKDPVNSLTLPFWRHVVPGLRVLVCVRHPADVAASLRARHGWPLEVGLELWRSYAQRILADGGPGGRVTTHYDAYFQDGRRELRRVVHALGLRVADDVVAAALTSCRTALRHHRHVPADAALPPSVAIPYAVLCQEAGVDPELQAPRTPGVQRRSPTQPAPIVR
jgi:hypothetical protein